MNKIDILAEALHEWYLEATKELKPESYNKEAQKQYSELTEEQKEIDKYIAKKIHDMIKLNTEVTILTIKSQLDDIVDKIHND